MIHAVRLLSYDEASEQGLKRSATDAGIIDQEHDDHNPPPLKIVNKEPSLFDLEGLSLDFYPLGASSSGGGSVTLETMHSFFSFLPVSGNNPTASGAGGYPVPSTPANTGHDSTPTPPLIYQQAESNRAVFSSNVTLSPPPPPHTIASSTAPTFPPIMPAPITTSNHRLPLILRLDTPHSSNDGDNLLLPPAHLVHGIMGGAGMMLSTGASIFDSQDHIGGFIQADSFDTHIVQNVAAIRAKGKSNVT